MSMPTLPTPVVGANSNVLIPIPAGGRITITVDAAPSTGSAVVSPMRQEKGASFGVWLRERRLARGLSQEGLARLAGMDRPHISIIEQGRIALPRYETRQFLHKHLGTSESDLIALGIVEGER